MTRGTLRDRWRREVYRSPAVGDACKLLLLAMADEMRDDGYVTVPRETLAKRLDRADRRISERIAEAVDARLLDRVQRGQKGRTATYRALLPDPRLGGAHEHDHDRLRVTAGSTLKNGHLDEISIVQGDDPEHPEVSPDRHPESRFRVTPGGPASSKHTGTAADRAACEPGTSETRYDSGSPEPARLRRAVAVDGAA